MIEQIRPEVSVPIGALRRLSDLMARGNRVLLGLVGPPGAGKSTVSLALATSLGPIAQVVPMDGFHLASSELVRLGRAERKGAPDTFDSAGFAALLTRIRDQRDDEVVYAPEFRRDIEESVAGAIPIFGATEVIIVEGNYLLLDDARWGAVAALLDDVWYVEVADDLRRQRLVRRHESYGRSTEQAEAWVENTDEPNARLIATTKTRADFVLRME